MGDGDESGAGSSFRCYDECSPGGTNKHRLCTKGVLQRVQARRKASFEVSRSCLLTRNVISVCSALSTLVNISTLLIKLPLQL